jgi:hypothetical protein
MGFEFTPKDIKYILIGQVKLELFYALQDFMACSIWSTTSVVWWSEFLATGPGPGSIPGAARFSEK